MDDRAGVRRHVTQASTGLRVVNFLRLLFALVVFAVSLLAIFSAPTYLAWQVSIGVTEWGHVLALIALLVFLPGWRKTATGRASALLALIALLLALSPLLRASPIAQTLPDQLASAFGGRNPREGPGAPSRSIPLSYRDLFTGVTSPPVRLDTVTYVTRSGKPLGLDLYRPVNPPFGPLPLVIVIHGGSWRGGSRSDLPELNRYLAARGYAVASVSYRFAPQNPHPAASNDVHTAVQVLESSARGLGVDASRIVLIGRSAGGQLALLEAYTAKDPAIRGVVSLYAPSDQVFGYENPANPRVLNTSAILEDYLAGNPRTVPDAYRTASPINFVNGSTVPTLLIHGARDELVWVRQSDRLDSKLAAANRPHFFLRLPWATHGCDYNFSGPCGQLSTYAIETFLGEAMR
jgi:acetyl esterase/lipase